MTFGTIPIFPACAIFSWLFLIVMVKKFMNTGRTLIIFGMAKTLQEYLILPELTGCIISSALMMAVLKQKHFGFFLKTGSVNFL